MKLFEKIKTKKALESAKNEKTNLEKTIEAIKTDMVNNNTRAAHKALHHAELKLEKTEARIGHIEVAKTCQSENHAKTFTTEKKTGIKKAKSRREKSFNKSSIVKPAVERFVWKDAKESAQWLDYLLTQQEIEDERANRRMQVVDRVTAKEEAEKEAFRLWWTDLHTEKSHYFNGKEKTYEAKRRAIANAEATKFLDHPAMASAAVFGEGLMAAELILGKNPGQLGGKNIFVGIKMRKDAIDDINAQIDDVKELIQSVYADWPELKAQVENCIKFGADNDIDTFKAIFEADSEALNRMSKKIRELKAQKYELKAEIRVLGKALKELRSGASKDELALIDAWTTVFAKKIRDKKNEQFGRPVMMCAKPMLKGYKLMHFDTKAIGKMFASGINAINKAADECADILNKINEGMKTEDDLVAAKDKLAEEFDKATKKLQKMLENGTKIVLNAADAKVHNGRQSQLTDVIGVSYGKPTELIMTFSHCVANIFCKNVGTYLDESSAKAEKKMTDFMELIINFLTQNGAELKLLPNDKGETKTLELEYWNSNNSQLKVGKGVLLSKKAYEKASLVGRAGMTQDEFESVLTNGSDMLKWNSYATTPGAPLMYNGEPLTINDVLVIKPVDTNRKFKNVLEYMKDGSSIKHEVDRIERTAYDGLLFFLVPIPSQQLRGGFAFKGFGLCCAYQDGTTMIDEIARRENWKIPEYVEDIDGKMRRWRDYKVICTADAWKWAGWKFEDGHKFSYEEYCNRMNALAKLRPCINQLYTARIADATEESRRQMTRQSIQQFIPACLEDIKQLFARSINKLNKLSTHAGVIRMMAGLDKPEDERTAFEHLVEVSPEILDHPYMRRAVEDTFNRRLAEAAVRPDVDGIYPYIAEDPVAFFKIVIWKKDPNELKLGYLNATQVNIPNEKEGTPLYIVRYPNNYLCGMLRTNHNDEIYRCCGNVMILSLDGGTLIRADGDTDGDEMCVVRDKAVVDMMADALRELCPPLVKFPHDKLEKAIYRGKKARGQQLAHAIVIANKYGPEVGKNSNLATKFMNKASLAHQEMLMAKDDDTRRKARWKREKALENAIIAHIAAIIAIDLAKTGSMPLWLENKLTEVKKFAGKKMPWNQRFCKDNKATPWFSEVWDDSALPQSDSVVDRGAAYVVEATNALNYVAPVGDEFDLDYLLGNTKGLMVQGSRGRLTQKKLLALEARNYRTKDTNDEGDDEYKLIRTFQSKDEKDTVDPGQFARFLWRNQAELVYVLQKEDSDKLDNAMMQNAYYEFCGDILGSFGSYCGNDTFMQLSAEDQRRSNVVKFIRMAFEAFGKDNGVGKNLKKTDPKKFTLKASFCLFLVKVFAYDLYQIACEQKNIENPWVKPAGSAATDCADTSAVESTESYNIGFSIAEEFCDIA